MSDGVGNAAWLALVAVVPLVALMLTSFVKMSVVLSLLRNAIGATDAPSGLVVMGLSLVLTFFVMAPVAVEMVTAASTVPAAPGVPGAPGAPTVPGGARPSGSAPFNGASGAATTESDAGGVSAETSSADGVAAAPSPKSAPGIAVGNAANAPGATNAADAPNAAGAPNATNVAGAPNGANALNAVGASTAASAPTATKPLELDVAVRALVPAKHHGTLDALERGLAPLRAFLQKHAGERDRATFVELAARMGRKANGDELWVLAPAFLTTELREAFAIAVLIFVPFLVIDLLVGLGLAALGLSTTSPQTVALPFKLLLFVAVDGWRLLVESMLKGYV